MDKLINKLKKHLKNNKRFYIVSVGWSPSRKLPNGKKITEEEYYVINEDIFNIIIEKINDKDLISFMVNSTLKKMKYLKDTGKYTNIIKIDRDLELICNIYGINGYRLLDNKELVNYYKISLGRIDSINKNFLKQFCYSLHTYFANSLYDILMSIKEN